MSLRSFTGRKFQVLALVTTLLTSGCSNNVDSSNSYELGFLLSSSFAQGQIVGEEQSNRIAEDIAQLLDAENFDYQSLPPFEVTEKGCLGTWIFLSLIGYVGPYSEISNTDENKSDFIRGCLDGVKS